MYGECMHAPLRYATVRIRTPAVNGINSHSHSILLDIWPIRIQIRIQIPIPILGSWGGVR